MSTAPDFDRICEARSGTTAAVSSMRDFAGPDWFEQRQAEIAFADREPDVLIVGGGHAGISAAVEFNRIGLDALVIDKEKRVGDNWRLRYHGLKLHNKTPVNHLRYLPFPTNLPGLHSEGQDRELAGKLCRYHGGQLLDRDGFRGRRL